MWSSSNLPTRPSEEDIYTIENEIYNLEFKLQAALIEAPDKVHDLEHQISERRAWIAPVWRLPLDLLSMIFIECSKDSSMAPLTLQCVCRHWRQSLFSTPAVWSFIYMGYKCPLDVIRTFIERSAPIPLHIRIPSSKGRDRRLEAMKHVDRIQCFTTENLSHLVGMTFPALRKLELGTRRYGRFQCLYGSRFPGHHSILDVQRFPQLCTLVVIGNRARHYLPATLSVLVPSAGFPPLAHLRIDGMTSIIRELLLVIRNCAKSLVKLRVRIVGANDRVSRITLERPLNLPVLQKLVVEVSPSNTMPIFTWPANMSTPALQWYRQITAPSHCYSLHADTKTVTHLKLYHYPLDPSGYPMARRLHLPLSELSVALAYLMENPGSFPHLESLQYEEDGSSDSVKIALRHYNERFGKSVQLKQTKWNSVSFTYQCSPHMPCHTHSRHLEEEYLMRVPQIDSSEGES